MKYLAYPVSLVMEFWHTLLSFVVDPDSGVAWAGSVLLLVVTIRLVLMRSMWNQQYSMRKMAQLAPQMKEVQKKYKDDRQAQALEMQKLYTEAGVHPAAGCLPLLIQIPVFLGLYHLLISFTPRDKTLEEASQMSNATFSPEQVASFLRAEIFGVPLSAYIRMPQDVLDKLHPGLDHTAILWLAVPLFVLAGLATFVNMWNSFRRQEAAKKAEKEALAQAELEERAGGPVVDGEVLDGNGEVVSPGAAGAGAAGAGADPAKKHDADPTKPEIPNFAETLQESMAQSMKTMMYIFPFFPIVGAIFLNFPIAIGLYWLTNNIWTAVQSHFYMEKLEKELPMTSREGLPPSAFM